MRTVRRHSARHWGWSRDRRGGSGGLGEGVYAGSRVSPPRSIGAASTAHPPMGRLLEVPAGRQGPRRERLRGLKVGMGQVPGGRGQGRRERLARGGAGKFGRPRRRGGVMWSASTAHGDRVTARCGGHTTPSLPRPYRGPEVQEGDRAFAVWEGGRMTLHDWGRGARSGRRVDSGRVGRVLQHRHRLSYIYSSIMLASCVIQNHKHMVAYQRQADMIKKGT